MSVYRDSRALSLMTPDEITSRSGDGLAFLIFDGGMLSRLAARGQADTLLGCHVVRG